MQKRLLIVSSLALGSVLLLGDGIDSAAAQDKKVAALNPQTGWSVLKVDGNNNPAGSYCALSREYDQGMVLTLGRNAAEEYSMAIDFQSATLNPDKAYTLTLQPGGGQIRAYEMMPASKRAMVIRLGYDDSFFEALEQSGELKAEVDGNNYQFKVTDFKTGKADLDNCLSGIKGTPETKVVKDFSAEKVENAKPMAEKPKAQAPKIEIAKDETKEGVEKITAAPAPEVKEMAAKEEPSKKIEMAKTDSVVEKPAQPAAEKVAAAEPSRTSKLIEIARVETTQVDPSQAPAAPIALRPADDAKDQPKLGYNVRSNNDALVEKAAANQAPSNDTLQPAQTNDQKKQREALQKLQADNARLTQALQAEMDKPEVASPEKNKEMAALQLQIDALQTELMKAKNEPNEVDAKLQADIEKLKSENEQLKLNMQARAIEAEREQQRLAEQQAAAEQEKQRLAAEKAAVEAEQQRLAAEAEKQRLAAEAELQKQILAEEQAAAAEQERLRLIAEEAEARKQREAEAEQERQRLIAEAEMEKQRQAAIAAEEEKQRLAEEQLAAAEQERQRALAEAEMEKQRLAAEKAMAEQEQQRLAAEQAAAEQEKQKLAVQQLAAAEQEKQRLAAEQAAAELERQRLAAEQAAAELEKQRLATEQEKQKLAAEKAAAEQAKQRLAAELAATEQEKQRLAAEQAAAEQERQKLAAAQAATASRAVEAESLTPEPVDPQMASQLEKLNAENARLSSAVEGQEQKMAAFDTNSPEAEAQLMAMRAEVERLKAENKKLYNEASEARSSIDNAVVQTGNQAFKKIREYEKKLEAAQNDNLSLSKEIEELRRMQEDGRLGAVSGDWDLEQATARYNEAEREIKRLGMLLEQQRVAHRQEKGELEQMLFDPAVTDKEQRRRLTELELQLAAAERELQAAGRGLPARPSIPRAIASAPQGEHIPISSITEEQSQFVDQQRDNLEIQRLNNQIARQNQQLQAYNRAQRGSEQMAVASAPPVQRVAMQQPSQPGNPKFDHGNLQQLLRQAGVPLSGNVTKQAAGQYRWSAGQLTGQAQIVPQSQAGSMEQFAQSYISRAKQSCGGDFASLPSASASGNAASYEIACISPTRSTSSSVVFTQRGGDFLAIAHEGSTENMDAAMDARDRVASSL